MKIAKIFNYSCLILAAIIIIFCLAAPKVDSPYNKGYEYGKTYDENYGLEPGSDAACEYDYGTRNWEIWRDGFYDGRQNKVLQH